MKHIFIYLDNNSFIILTRKDHKDTDADFQISKTKPMFSYNND